jgi:hypothetical protein
MNDFKEGFRQIFKALGSRTSLIVHSMFFMWLGPLMLGLL